MDLHKDSDKLTKDGPFGSKINPPVFWITVVLMAIFVTASLIWLEDMESIFQYAQAFISKYFGWFYILTVNFLLFFCIYLFFGKYSTIRIGGKDSKPEFTYWQWFAMLFNAGIGLALMFYALAEPMMHFANPPAIEGHQRHPAQMAFTVTYLHWGIHGWAIYGIVGLCVAFFTFNRDFSLNLRSVLFPTIGNRIYGPIGNTVDIISTIATLFGLATTMGIGIQYMSTGMDHLFNWGNSEFTKITLVTLLTIGATISLVLGLSKGIKNLSMISAWLAISILTYIFVMGPTLFILDSFVQNTGHYLQNMLAMGTWSDVFSASTWQDEWTLFYWGWWFAWAPFVGIFVARISKGRTIGEFVGGVILAPTFAIIVWVTILGGAGIYEELFGTGGISAAVNEDITTAIYVLLEKYPLPFLSSFVVIVTGGVFFITSSDSGSYVVNSLASATEGDDTPKFQRIFWAVLEGVVALVLLLGGGLVALQTASLIAGLPVAVLTLIMCYGLMKELKKERKVQLENNTPETNDNTSN